MSTIEKEIRDIKRMLTTVVGDSEWLTPEKVESQYGYSKETLRKFYRTGKITIKKGKTGKMILYKRSDIESLFITIPKIEAS